MWVLRKLLLTFSCFGLWRLWSLLLGVRYAHVHTISDNSREFLVLIEDTKLGFYRLTVPLYIGIVSVYFRDGFVKNTSSVETLEDFEDGEWLPDSFTESIANYDTLVDMVLLPDMRKKFKSLFKEKQEPLLEDGTLKSSEDSRI